MAEHNGFVACVQLGLAFTGIERERGYFDAACERIARAQAAVECKDACDPLTFPETRL